MARSVFDDYISSHPEVLQLYSFAPDNWEQAIHARQKKRNPLWQKNELDELKAFNRRIGNTDQALGKIDLLGQNDTYVIVTGQQPGVFGGPLYTIFKALTAISLSETVSREFGINVLPFFWVASEDHDFEEARTFKWLDMHGQIASYSYTPEHYQPGSSLFHIPIEDSLNTLIETLERTTHPTEFKKDILYFLRSSIAKSENLEDLFARLMARLFADEGLILFSPRLNCVLQRIRGLYRREIATAPNSSRMLIEHTKLLTSMGYKGVIHRTPDDVNLFTYIDNQRHKMEVEGDTVIVRHVVKKAVQHQITREKMLEMVSETPEQFSSNVVMRPLVQDSVLPTIAYVGGPTEIEYFAQLKSLYEFFDVFMPIMYPRARGILIEPRIERALKKCGLTADELISGPRREISKKVYTGECGESETLKELEKIKTRMFALVEEIERTLSDSDVSVRGAAKKLRGSLGGGFDRLETRIAHINEQHNTQTRTHQDKLYNALLPEDGQQERTLGCIAPFWFNYGPQFVPFLRACLDPKDFTIQKVLLSKVAT